MSSQVTVELTKEKANPRASKGSVLINFSACQTLLFFLEERVRLYYSLKKKENRPR